MCPFVALESEMIGRHFVISVLVIMEGRFC
jgi:hypothetical protein